VSERVFTVQRAIARTPWDVFDFIADSSQQHLWREREGMASQHVVESQPYTRIEYSDRMVFELEPEGEGTLVTLTRSYEGSGFVGVATLRMFSRKSREYDMGALLARIEAAMVYDNI
jgi:hypothetical protein